MFARCVDLNLMSIAINLILVRSLSNQTFFTGKIHSIYMLRLNFFLQILTSMVYSLSMTLNTISVIAAKIAAIPSS